MGESVLPASGGCVNGSVHQKENACWPAAVGLRNKSVKRMAIWRSFCLQNFSRCICLIFDVSWGLGVLLAF